MSDLHEMNCVACRAGEAALSAQEVASLLPRVPAWTVVDAGGVGRLERTFKFPNFSTAIAFTNQVAAVAQAQDHHPLITTEWGRVLVQWWTHKVRGLHQNDFVMAAKTDRLYGT